MIGAITRTLATYGNGFNMGVKASISNLSRRDLEKLERVFEEAASQVRSLAEKTKSEVDLEKLTQDKLEFKDLAGKIGHDSPLQRTVAGQEQIYQKHNLEDECDFESAENRKKMEGIVKQARAFCGFSLSKASALVDLDNQKTKEFLEEIEKKRSLLKQLEQKSGFIQRCVEFVKSVCSIKFK